MNRFEDFKGKIGRTHTESTPWWPEPKGIGKDYPNVIVILFDDTGFSQFGCYGSNIDTPNIDRLAQGGLRYTNFHTTALCSPTHHAVGVRSISNYDTGFPHMRGYITPHAATVAEILRENGYSTLMVGKWHLAPMFQTSAAGPFDNWPLQRGFNRYYGFMQGETDQFYPELTYDNHPIDPPKSPEEGYHLNEDLIDKSIDFIRDHESIYPKQPFFLYLAFGATHTPHQAPKEFIDKYKGRFDAGWDVIREQWYKNQLEMGIIPTGTKLAPHNPGVEPWETLSDKEKNFALKLQEVFAAFLDHTDHHIGRLLSFLDEMNIMDDTMIILLSDNGAAPAGGKRGVMHEFKSFNGIPEDIDQVQDLIDNIGGPHSYPNYPWGWAQTGNTPLKWYKSYTYGGGIRDSCIFHWPAHIKDRGGIRNQFHHVSDIVPTIFEMLKIDPPSVYNGYDQLPITGTSMVYTFESSDEPSRKEVQYFEMFGRRGIWVDGWKAVTNHLQGQPYDHEEWQLYNLDEDFSECNNLAEVHPEKLRKLIDLWWVEAGKHGVLPLDDRTVELFSPKFLPGYPHEGREYTYYPPISKLPSDVSPAIGNRSWIMTAKIQRSSEDIDGVIFTYGTQNVGLSCYIKNNQLVFDYNIYTDHHVVRSNRTIPPGLCTIGVLFERKDDKGNITLFIEDKECGSIHIPSVLRMISASGLQVGRNGLSPITNDYETPFEFKGTINKIKFKLLRYNPTPEDAQNRFDAEMAKQ
ncbi:MAG: arylsulfatase [Promethearchaeota archaeon]|jgi:arylsulfatase